MKKLIIFFWCILFLTGCYEFESPPFNEDELKPIVKTKFGKEILKVMRNASVGKESPEDLTFGSLEDLTDESKVFDNNNKWFELSHL